jgi:hypothetical protein
LANSLGITVDRLKTNAISALVLITWLAGADACGQTTAPAAPPSRAPIAAPGREMESKVLVDDLSGPLQLAASPTGQTLFTLRLEARDVLGIDLADPTKRWTAVPAIPGSDPKALGVIDSSTLASWRGCETQTVERGGLTASHLIAPGIVALRASVDSEGST